MIVSGPAVPLCKPWEKTDVDSADYLESAVNPEFAATKCINLADLWITILVSYLPLNGE